MKTLSALVIASAALSTSCVELLALAVAPVAPGALQQVLFSDLFPASSAEEIEHHDYVGVDRCGNARCHGSERLGNQMAVWEVSAHEGL